MPTDAEYEAAMRRVYGETEEDKKDKKKKKKKKTSPDLTIKGSVSQKARKRLQIMEDL